MPRLGQAAYLQPMHPLRSQADYEALRQFLMTALQLPPDTAEALLPGWHPFTAPRKTILTAAGEREPYLYFVVEGVQRAFYLGERDRQEATLMFSYAPSFSGAAEAFLTQQPSAYFLETLTASRFLRITHPAFVEQLNHFPLLERRLLFFMGELFRGLLERQVEMQCFTAEEKFRALLTRSPHILQLAPHKYLASYLGIDPSTFSKLLGSVKVFTKEEDTES
ncbi:MAG: Crp/Fnr family transcriptional regulator [Lewinella sp.]|nr:Crp/Fnr family transcriptional regulator [Lewinella sp.]